LWREEENVEIAKGLRGVQEHAHSLEDTGDVGSQVEGVVFAEKEHAHQAGVPTGWRYVESGRLVAG
jgi:hypothetical protein